MSTFDRQVKVRLSERKTKKFLSFSERLRVGERSSGIREYLRPKVKERLREQKSKIILRFLERLRVGERSSGIREYLRPKVKERLSERKTKKFLSFSESMTPMTAGAAVFLTNPSRHFYPPKTVS